MARPDEPGGAEQADTVLLPLGEFLDDPKGGLIEVFFWGVL